MKQQQPIQYDCLVIWNNEYITGVKRKETEVIDFVLSYFENTEYFKEIKVVKGGQVIFRTNLKEVAKSTYLIVIHRKKNNKLKLYLTDAPEAEIAKTAWELAQMDEVERAFWGSNDIAWYNIKTKELFASYECREVDNK